MSNVVVLQVENTLGVLDDGGRVRGDEELDRLGHAIVAQERARLTADELAGRSSRGNKEAAARLGLRDGLSSLVGRAELDVDKVNLELLLRLDSDEDGGSSAGDDNLVGVVDGLEDESEGSLLQDVAASERASEDGRWRATHELHDHTLDEGSERDLLPVLRVVEVLGEDGSDLGVGVTLEDVSSLLQDEPELLVCSSPRQDYPRYAATHSQLVMIPLCTTVNSMRGSETWG